ncbi:probable maleylacetoacetate isomerase 1 [Caerostris darwini]|uniref:maleylacetoacetate isomerase n=1 Tax=Caerostris darwini TaxID=1538125 RepID=A0AAV4U2U3_9ARAC|nr:probable maleylacetoacetate isomerase 1 [Caerostris darwini]
MNIKLLICRTANNCEKNFLKLNPLGQVPALIINGNVLTQSCAILEYLEETVPHPPLLPKDPVYAAEVRKIVDVITSGIQPLQNDRVLRYVGEKSNKWAKHWIHSGFENLERILQKTHGKYCVGNDVTLADVCLVPQVFRASQFQVDLLNFPIIRNISQRLNRLSAFSDTHPFQQPDCPINVDHVM